MLVRLEPKDWLMHAVYLFFDEDKPDPEDQEVRDYLAAHGLEPKRDTTTTWDGREWYVMYFGGCYLGRHLRVLSEMPRRAADTQQTADADVLAQSRTGAESAPYGRV